MQARKQKQQIFKLVELAILIALVVLLQFFGSGIRIGTTSFSLVLIPIVLGGMLLGPSAGAVLGFVFGAITLYNGITGADAFTAILLNSGIKGAIMTPIICLGKGTFAGLGAGLVYKLLKDKNNIASTFATVISVLFSVITICSGVAAIYLVTAISQNLGIEDTATTMITIVICLERVAAAVVGAVFVYKQLNKLLKNKNSIVATFAAAATAPILNTGLFILGALTLSDVLAANFVAEGSTVIYFLVIGCAGVNFIVEFLVNVVVSPALHRVITAIQKGRV